MVLRMPTRTSSSGTSSAIGGSTSTGRLGRGLDPEGRMPRRAGERRWPGRCSVSSSGGAGIKSGASTGGAGTGGEAEAAGSTSAADSPASPAKATSTAHAKKARLRALEMLLQPVSLGRMAAHSRSIPFAAAGWHDPYLRMRAWPHQLAKGSSVGASATDRTSSDSRSIPPIAARSPRARCSPCAPSGPTRCGPLQWPMQREGVLRRRRCQAHRR